MTPNNSHQVHYLRQHFQRRQCEAEFGVTRAITSVDFRKLVKMGLAEKLGAGRSTRYRLKGLVQSSSNRQVKPTNRKVKGENSMKGGRLYSGHEGRYPSDVLRNVEWTIRSYGVVHL